MPDGAVASDLQPGFFNIDQVPQFASDEFAASLKNENTNISMADRSRVYDNIFIERFWRTGKCEENYLHEHRTVAYARAGLATYSRFCNEALFPKTLGYRTLHEVYFGTPARQMQWQRLLFSRDGLKIVSPRISDEIDFAVVLKKMAFGHRHDQNGYERQVFNAL